MCHGSWLVVQCLFYLTNIHIRSVSVYFFVLFQTWLFGYEVPDLIVVLTKMDVFFLGSQKKGDFASPVVSSEKQGSVPPVTFLVRDKVGNEGLVLFYSLIRAFLFLVKK